MSASVATSSGSALPPDVAANRSAGYDRAMGVFGGNVSDHSDVLVANDAGKKIHHRVDAAWSTAASVGAAGHGRGKRYASSFESNWRSSITRMSYQRQKAVTFGA